MNKYTTIALAAAAFASGGCKDSTTVRSVNAPTAEALGGALNRTSLQALATGVLAQDRTAIASSFTYVILSGIFARDVYRIDSSEPRYVSETLGGQPDAGSFAGGGGFADFFIAIRAANNLILALPTAAATDVSAAEKSATAGFIKTIKALEYYRLIELRDTVGVPIQSDNQDEVTPIRCKSPVLAYVQALLDSANTDLTAAGAATKLPFTLPSGFTANGRDYSVVSNIIRLNRGLKGKVDFYTGLNRKAVMPALYATAIAELTQALGGAAPGAVSPSTFNFGPYYNFGAAETNAAANNRADAKIGLNPLIRDSIQAGDARASKIVSRPVLSGGGISTTVTASFAVATPANQALPLPILRDEELVLIRAQAYIEAGNFAAATADLNSVRTFNRLAPYAVFTSREAARSAALYEKRFSLLLEGPQRLVDLREYGRLNNTFFRRETPTDPFNAAFPIPRGEQNARNGNITCQ
ncbi:MAG: hypothetical protein WKF55_12830 [Gemmatimonadaceae bacterium]